MTMTQRKNYDEICVDRFNPNHSVKVRFERRGQKPSSTAKVKVTRAEALWLLCQHVDHIVQIEWIIAQGQYDSGQPFEIAHANDRIDVLIKAGLVSEVEARGAYEQILSACGGPFKKEDLCDCERCNRVEPPMMKIGASNEAKKLDDTPF
jgi:hypothetical protein